MNKLIGSYCYKLAKNLWPINRSITGQGIRDSLLLLKKEIPELLIHQVKSGTKCFDWVIPEEWNVSEAHITCPDGKKIIDFSTNNLHLMGYSVPTKATLNLDDLQNHLHSIEDQPDAIPYVTSYYEKNWGFCLSHSQRVNLKYGNYSVVIKSSLEDGYLNYGELIIPGQSSKEIFLSTYICHPSMANNELSGPVLTTAIAKYLLTRKDNKFTYRIIFIPETIGSIAYLSRNLLELQTNVFAGYNITCVGDERAYSYLPSRNGNTPSDAIAKHILKHINPNYIAYTWDDRGSDERQFCAPGVDLPIASIMRSKYGTYPEYHTSLDALGSVVTETGLAQSYDMYLKIIEALENFSYPKILCKCEPQLGKRNLYPNISKKNLNPNTRLMMNIITWSDGFHSTIEIADKCNIPVWELYPEIHVLMNNNLIAT